MAVQPSQALKQYVARSEVRDEKVSVNVEALLKGLGAYQNRAGAAVRRLAERRLNRIVEDPSVRSPEATVMRSRYAPDPPQDGMVDA